MLPVLNNEQIEQEKKGSLLALMGYGLVLFVSSFLMFVIEPFIAKLLLPYLGGTSNVWNTCVVFFQFSLILGYFYAYLVSTKLEIKKQRIIHAFVLLLPVALTTFNPSFEFDKTSQPYLWLLSNLVLMIGALFFSLSTVAPLFQSWYSFTRSPGAKDPYFLFAASNAGALLGLICYPFFIEGNFGIKEQSQFVYSLYIALAILILAIVLLFKVENIPRQEPQSSKKLEDSVSTESGNWLISAAIPASLVLGVTSFVTGELSSLPLLWIIPLFIYLLSFVIVFSKPPKILFDISSKLTPIMSLGVFLLIIYQVHSNTGDGSGFAVTSGISFHLITLLVVSIHFHGKLAKSRPETGKLTEFYLIIAIGGMLGSFFNTFLAPQIFSTWLEYPLVLGLSCVLTLGYPKILQFKYKSKHNCSNLFFTAVVSIVCVASIKVFQLDHEFITNLLKDNSISLLVFCLPILITVLICNSKFQSQIGVAISLFTFTVAIYFLQPDVVYMNRNFYGCTKLSINSMTNRITFWHGLTVHGSESLDPAKRSRPEAYFHPNSPIGELFSIVNPEKENESNKNDAIAVIGLGCGTLAAYGQPGQKMFFYELNPEVVRVAKNPFYFTYLFNAQKRAVGIEIIEGDGRQSLTRSPYNYFKAIILDAFNSDSIPTHLITKEAIKLYESKLKDDGVIAFQVTNNYFDLKPQLYLLAKDASYQVLYKNDYGLQREENRFPTEWVIMTRNETLAQVFKSRDWKELNSDRKLRLWTDDYSNPLPLIISDLD